MNEKIIHQGLNLTWHNFMSSIRSVLLLTTTTKLSKHTLALLDLFYYQQQQKLSTSACTHTHTHTHTQRSRNWSHHVKHKQKGTYGRSSLSLALNIFRLLTNLFHHWQNNQGGLVTDLIHQLQETTTAIKVWALTYKSSWLVAHQFQY